MINEIKKGTQSDNDVWVLHKTKDIKALVNEVNEYVEILERAGYGVEPLKEALKPFVKQKKDE